MNRVEKDKAAKAEIMRRIRAALQTSQIQPIEVPRDYRRTGEDEPGSQPVIETFVEALEDYNAIVDVVTEDEVSAAIGKALEGDATVVIPEGLDSSWLSAVSGEVKVDKPGAQLSHRELSNVAAVLTSSRCAVSHTGTILLDGDKDQGRRAITLVPDKHVVLVAAKNVFPTVPQAVDLLGEHPQRPITWIAGPSATSDIELVRVDGVHGPRTLHVIIVK